MATIAELVEDRTVEGVYAVAKKERRRTRAGAPYLALELSDASGRIEARVWSDVELLDQRFAEGDAVRVLGRVESFGGKLQVQVRALETVEDADPATLTPGLRRDADELDGFLEFLAAEIAHPGLAAVVGSFLGDAEIRASLRALPAAGAEGHHGYAGGLLEHTVGVTTLCRETAELHQRLRARPPARRRAPARRRQDTRARARPGLPPDRGRTAPRTCPPRAAPDRGALARSRPGRARGAPARRRVPPRPPRGAHRRGRRPLPREPARRPGRDAPRRRLDGDVGSAARALRRVLVGRRRLPRRARLAKAPGARRPRRLAGDRAGRDRALGRGRGRSVPRRRRAPSRRRRGRRGPGRPGRALPRAGRRRDGHRGADLRRLARSSRSQPTPRRARPRAPSSGLGIALVLTGIVDALARAFVGRRPPARSGSRPRARRGARLRPVRGRARRRGRRERSLGGRRGAHGLGLDRGRRGRWPCPSRSGLRARSCPCSSASASSTPPRTSSSRSRRTQGAAGIVAVLSALYPVVTVLLARIVLAERLSSARRVGGVVALAGRRPRRRRLDVEADVDDVAVLDDVRLALEPLQPAAGRLGVRSALEQVVPADDLGADEAARDVRVDRLRRVERGLAVLQRPRARLGVADGVERDQAERVLQPADDLVERGRARRGTRRPPPGRARRAPSRACSRSRRARSRP